MADSGDWVADGNGAARGLERARTILAEIVEAARSAAESLAHDQKQQAAGQVAAVGDAVRCAARSLDRSESAGMARQADRAAARIEDFSRAMRDRRWGEIVADTEDFARHQPVLFALGAAAAGFLAGRLLAAPTEPNRRRPPLRTTASGNGVDAVTAAVSSATGNGAMSGYTRGISGRPDTR